MQKWVGKKLDWGIRLSVSPLSLFLSYLVLVGETMGMKGGKKKNPQSSKDQLQGRSEKELQMGCLDERKRTGMDQHNGML